MHLLEASTLKEAFSLEARQSLAGTALKLMPESCQLSVKPVNHPLLSCFCLSAGFSATKGAEQEALVFRIALMSMIPVTLPLESIQVSISVSQYPLCKVTKFCGGKHAP